MRAGTPIAVRPVGTSDRTSELGAIVAPPPIVTGSKNAGMGADVDVIADIGDAGSRASADRANLAQCAAST